MFDYGKLRGRIREKCKTEGEFAKAMGIGRVSLSGRLNNKADFTRLEIARACEVLALEDSEISEYFFAKKVQVSELDESQPNKER